MRIVGGVSDSVTIQWKHADRSFDAKLYIGGSPWRTWAYKTVYDPGDWTVSVSDENGFLLKELTFTGH